MRPVHELAELPGGLLASGLGRHQHVKPPTNGRISVYVLMWHCFKQESQGHACCAAGLQRIGSPPMLGARLLPLTRARLAPQARCRSCV
jgi:hypothetical protein